MYVPVVTKAEGGLVLQCNVKKHACAAPHWGNAFLSVVITPPLVCRRGFFTLEQRQETNKLLLEIKRVTTLRSCRFLTMINSCFRLKRFSILIFVLVTLSGLIKQLAFPPGILWAPRVPLTPGHQHNTASPRFFRLSAPSINFWGLLHKTLCNIFLISVFQGPACLQVRGHVYDGRSCSPRAPLHDVGTNPDRPTAGCPPVTIHRQFVS